MANEELNINETKETLNNQPLTEEENKPDETGIRPEEGNSEPEQEITETVSETKDNNPPADEITQPTPENVEAPEETVPEATGETETVEMPEQEADAEDKKETEDISGQQNTPDEPTTVESTEEIPAVEVPENAEEEKPVEPAPVEASITDTEPKEEEKAEEPSEAIESEKPSATEYREPQVGEIIDVPTEEKPAEPAPPKEIAEEVPAEDTEDKEEAAEEEEREPKRRPFDDIFEKLKEIKENDETIEVFVKSRIRGGLRVIYEGMQIFLPSSHFSLKRNPQEEQLLNVVNSNIKVHVHELQEDEQGRKTVIVSRKRIIEDEIWNNIKEGDVVEGVVSSIASFGVFVDIGGVEGLIHISRLSRVHVDDPRDFVKKGETIKAVVVEADRERNRIALSRKELEESPWKDVPEKFPLGSQHKGIVRRLTDFGAYVELKPGVDGLLRTSELSWTKRIKKPSDVLNPDQEIDIEIIALSEEKQNVTLSYKRTQPNPWAELKEKYPIGTEFDGTILQVMPQGAIVTVTEDLDGFMPRSKIKPLMKGKKIPFNPGDEIRVSVADLIPEDESLILTPVFDEKEIAASRPAPERRSDKRQTAKPQSGDSSFTLSDLISQKDQDKLRDQMTD